MKDVNIVLEELKLESEALQSVVLLLMGVIEKHDLCIPHEVVHLSLIHLSLTHDIELGEEEDIEIVYEDEEDG